jgi:hypothetical protein
LEDFVAVAEVSVRNGKREKEGKNITQREQSFGVRGEEEARFPHGR